MLFEVELIINNAPKYYGNIFNNQLFGIWKAAIIF